VPPHLQAQREELQAGSTAHRQEQPSILSFTDASQRAAG